MTLLLGLVIPVLTGHLVPVSRAERAEAVVEVQKATIDSQNRTNIVQEELIKQLQAGNVATERLISALKAVIPPLGGGHG